MHKAKNMLPEIIEHINPLVESSVAPAMPQETRPLITVDINTELLRRYMRYLKQMIPTHIPKI